MGILLTSYTTSLKRTLEQLPFESIEKMVDYLHQARLMGKQVFVMGNGGSATTAAHLASDLGKSTITAYAPRFRAIALTDNIAIFSAIANDLGYENVFAEQLLNFVEKGDIVIAISASGNSPNILKAISVAKKYNAFTIGWSGYDGGKLVAKVDLPIIIPNDSIQQIEDVHLILVHMITLALRESTN